MESSLSTLLPQLKPLATAAEFDALAKICALVAAGKRSAADAESAASASGTSIEAQGALVAFFLEVARSGGSADELAAKLGSVLPEDRAGTVVALASEGLPTMRTTLDLLSLGPDELVDVSWQRAVIAAAGHEQPRPGGTTIYTVTLTTRATDGSTKPLQFVASTEELTDLVRCARDKTRRTPSPAATTQSR